MAHIKVYSSIIDNILDEPDLSPNFGEEGMGDEKNRGDDLLDLTSENSDNGFLDDIAGDSRHTNLLGGPVTAGSTNLNHRAGRALETGILAEAADLLTPKAAAPKFHFASLKEAAKIGEFLANRSRQTEGLHTAAARLNRVLAKTPAQMKADGAKTANDYANTALIPGWAPQVRADIRTITAAFQAYLPTAPPKARAVFAAYIPSTMTDADTKSSGQAISDRQLTDAEVTGHITRLLNEGVSPKEVEEKISKLAELQMVNHSIATDYLERNSGLLGYAYIKPAEFMDSCAETYKRASRKTGKVRAQSVLKIAACEGCSSYHKNGKTASCGLYRLPIVANGAQLFPIISNLTPGAKTEIARKAALVSQANREPQRNSLDTKVADVRRTVRNDYKLGSTESRRTARTEDATFTSAEALKMHKAGSTLAATYKFALSKIGSARANKVIREFVGGLKKAKANVDLVQIDCTMLKGKLATANGIVGAKKCGSCTYRTGMHCGLTGGTLVTFEGIGRQASNHKIASGAPKDGTKMMHEFGMTRTASVPDIDISGPKFETIDMRSGSMDL